MVTITGSNFGPGGSSVSRSATADTSKVGPVRWMAPETLQITMPPSSGGGGGGGAIYLGIAVDGVKSNPVAFTYDPTPPADPAPVLVAVLPDTGITGGTLLTITGSNFSPAQGEAFAAFVGTTPVTPISASDTQLLVAAPDLPAGAAPEVGVAAKGRASNTVAVSYRACAVDGVDPLAQGRAGGIPITISGYFPDFPQVQVGADLLEPSDATRTSLHVYLPPRTVSFEDLAVVGGGEASNLVPLAFDGPGLSSIFPADLSSRGGTVITLNGQNFGNGQRVWVDDNEAAVTQLTATQMVCVAPGHGGGGGGGGGAVYVRSTAWDPRSNPLSVTYDPIPVITSLDPVAGRLAGGTPITIVGSDFGLSPQVTVGGLPASSSLQPEGLVCQSPPGASAGPRDVVVTAPGGEYSDPAGFEYLSPPVLTQLTPDIVPVAGGVRLTIQGSNFGPAAGSPPRSVRIGEQDATDLDWSQANTVLCTVPPAAGPGEAAVVVDVDGVSSPPLSLGYVSTTGVGDGALPTRFLLAQNRPNPFSGSTRIALALPRTTDYDLAVYDLSGRLVRRYRGAAGPGTEVFTWDGRTGDGRPAAPGVYFYRVRAGEYHRTLRMMLLR